MSNLVQQLRYYYLKYIIYIYVTIITQFSVVDTNVMILYKVKNATRIEKIKSKICK